MKKAVVTGGAGFIGSHMVRALVGAGFSVESIDVKEPSDARRVEGAVYHTADIRSYDAIAPIIAGAEYVFHFAALPRVQYSIDNPLETFAVNATGTMHVLAASKAGSVTRALFASSGSVYGDAEGVLSEALATKPMSPYALHKKMGEEMCALWSSTYGLSTVVLRYLNVYGPHMDPFEGYPLAIPSFLQQRAEGKPLTIAGDGTHTRDYVHVADVVRANLLAAESSVVGSGEVINIGTGKATSVNKIAALIGGETTTVEPRHEPAHARADITRAQKLLGWKPEITLEASIEELKKEFGV